MRRLSFGLTSLLAILASASLAGCWYYSFTGASIPEHLNTIAIPLPEDNTTSPLTNLSDALTQRLTTRFVGQTRLRLEPDEEAADVVLSTRLDNYANQPVSVSAQEQAELNRVTITVTVAYTDRVKDEVILSRQFSGSAEYDPALGLQNEERAAEVALDNIADDIFTEATSDW